MEFFKANTKINFMKQRKWAALLSLILFILSLGSLYMNGLDLVLEFTGGTQVQLHFQMSLFGIHSRFLYQGQSLLYLGLTNF